MRQFRAPKTVPLAFHEHHTTEIRISPKAPNGAMYWCVTCNKWISWLSKQEVTAAVELKLIPPVKGWQGKFKNSKGTWINLDDLGI
jgi:hypothetical protein